MTTAYDATGCVLGRLATHAAQDVLGGDEVVIVNCEDAIVTGRKNDVLERYKKKYEAGTQRKGPHFPRVPDRLVKRTVRGMLPYDKPRGREAFKRLRCYIGEPEEVGDADAEVPEDARGDTHRPHVTVAEISRFLGAKVRT